MTPPHEKPVVLKHGERLDDSPHTPDAAHAADAPPPPPRPVSRQDFNALKDDLDKAQRRGGSSLDHIRHRLHLCEVAREQIVHTSRQAAGSLNALADSLPRIPPPDEPPDDDHADEPPVRTRHSKAQHRANEKAAQAVADAAAADDAQDADSRAPT